MINYEVFALASGRLNLEAMKPGIAFVHDIFWFCCLLERCHFAPECRRPGGVLFLCEWKEQPCPAGCFVVKLRLRRMNSFRASILLCGLLCLLAFRSVFSGLALATGRSARAHDEVAGADRFHRYRSQCDEYAGRPQHLSLHHQCAGQLPPHRKPERDQEQRHSHYFARGDARQ